MKTMVGGMDERSRRRPEPRAYWKWVIHLTATSAGGCYRMTSQAVVLQRRRNWSGGSQMDNPLRETYGGGVPDGPGAGHGDQVGSIRKTIRLRYADFAHRGPFVVRLSDAAQPGRTSIAPTAEGQDG